MLLLVTVLHYNQHKAMKSIEQTPTERVHEMIERHGDQKAWRDKIDTLYKSYESQLLDAVKSFSSTMDIEDYIDVLNDSHRALVQSKIWKSWDGKTRDDSAFAFQVMMDFLIKLHVIVEKRRLERELQGI